MSPAPACSVIVPTYNRRALLDKTLATLVRQTLPGTAFEVLVVDDGSSDGTDALVRGWEGRLPVRYFFKPDEGFRLAEARNIGIRHARGEVCVFIDSGVLLHSRCLEAHLRSHAQAAGDAAVVGYVYGYNGEAPPAGSAELRWHDTDRAVGEFARQRGCLDVRETLYWRYGDRLQDWRAPWLVYWTGNVSASTALLRRIGLFDEAFRSWGVEDQDIGYRLHQAGARFMLEREAASVHEPHPHSPWRNYLSFLKNSEYFARKHGTPQARMILEHDLFEIEGLLRAAQGPLPPVAAPLPSRLRRLLRDRVLRHQPASTAGTAVRHAQWRGPESFEV
jgi:glycosyltransferase involved in cell wall biosynthesis